MGKPSKTATASAVVPPPVPVAVPTRRRPDFSGTPGELVKLDADLVFGLPGRTSPYDAYLDQLAKATDDWVRDGKQGLQPGLKFSDVRARPSVWARSRKKQLKVAFVEKGGALFVRLELPSEDIGKARRDKILQVLAAGPMAYIPLAARLIQGGDVRLDANQVEAICVQMSRNGLLIRQEGGAWAISPVKRTAATQK